MTLHQLLTNLDSREITEWQALFALRAEEKKPRPATADDIRAAFAPRVQRRN